MKILKIYYIVSILLGKLTRNKFFLYLILLFIFYVNYSLYIGTRNTIKLLNNQQSSTKAVDDGFLYEEAFLAYTNKGGDKVLEVLVKSIHHFSNKSIIAYGIDYNITLSKRLYPRLITEYLSSKECGGHVYICKPLVLLKSRIKYGVYVDADTVVNHKVDMLFDAVKSWEGSHVLSPIHWWDPNNTDIYLKRYNISEKTIHYVHADSILWNHRNLIFIAEWWDLCKEMLEANFDESALNVLLWKQKARHSMCLYDCFYSFYSGYMKNSFVVGDRPYIYMTFHGEKNPEGANKIFDTISVRDSKNDDSYLTRNCCQTSGKPSKFHKFICEY